MNTALVKIIEPEYRGRVFGVISSISGGAVPIAIFLGSIVMSYTSVAFLGVVCSLILLVPTTGFLVNSKVSALMDELEDPSPKELELLPQS